LFLYEKEQKIIQTYDETLVLNWMTHVTSNYSDISIPSDLTE